MVPDINVTVLAFKACLVAAEPNWNIALRLSLTLAGSYSVCSARAVKPQAIIVATSASLIKCRMLSPFETSFEVERCDVVRRLSRAGPPSGTRCAPSRDRERCCGYPAFPARQDRRSAPASAPRWRLARPLHVRAVAGRMECHLRQGGLSPDSRGWRVRRHRVFLPAGQRPAGLRPAPRQLVPPRPERGPSPRPRKPSWFSPAAAPTPPV